MKLTELRPMLWTENLDDSINFYVEILGFTCVERNDDWGWASVCKGDVGLMLSIANSHTSYEKIGFTGSFYFNTDNIDALWNELKGKTKVCYQLDNFEYGMREFGIYDNNGYLLQFGQENDAD
ncbi:MAG: VOC family protein [Pyrinomonadaceae bacterium]|nr:VOC family protein [Pyrinomonadaceae bacterium]